ncbi:hypothetical protein WJX81_007411 [Elliptochloris bilobata]|uniref:Vacuolar ATP synthase subunit E n=1 Tax=Elliptochloris bilobata TaxID=381761 RepID=A0AAW1SGL7_9CHLO
MNEVEVERQIDQMVRFIKQEAEEKANEIAVSAEEEFNIEKLQLLESEKTKIRKEYERREAQVEVKKKIEYSKQLNDSRIKVLQAREDAVQAIVKEAHNKLSTLTADKKAYRSLLTDLTVQALSKLKEDSATLKVREADLALLKEVAEPARSKYQQVFGKEAPSVAVDTKEFLPPAPKGSGDEEMMGSSGGVVATSASGKIVCSNTLDDRLRIAYSQNLSAVRAMLFGVTARA